MRFAVLLLVFTIDARVAAACSAALPDDHVLDPAYADDMTPPASPSVSVTTNLSIGTTCPDGVVVHLVVAARDDRAPTERIGYLLHNESRVVDPLYDRISRLLPPDSPSFTMQWSLRAVDLNGNMSEPTHFDVVYEVPQPETPPDDGCSVAGSPGLVLALLALARCTLRRHARPSA